MEGKVYKQITWSGS